MAKCEEGYLCEVCGGDVAEIWESELYLRFVIGDLDPERLHVARERHIRCVPAIAQFIVHPDFEPITCEGMLAKSSFDAEFVRSREELLTRGWQRLKEIAASPVELSIVEYPLPEVLGKLRG